MKSIPKGKNGLLHFAQLRSVTAKEVNEPEDSGNGYYSYSYYILPFTGIITPNSIGSISQILHKRFYSYPFNSMGFTKLHKQEGNKGEILFCVTYHHGD